MAGGRGQSDRSGDCGNGLRRSLRVQQQLDRRIQTDEDNDKPSKKSNATLSAKKSQPPDRGSNYHILIKRLEERLTKVSISDKEEKKELDVWCTCRMGDLGGASVRCDVPECRFVWYHLECLPVNDQIRAEKEGQLWICPLCIGPMLCDLFMERRGKREQLSLAQKMAKIDEQYRRDGRWIFDSPSQGVPTGSSPSAEAPSTLKRLWEEADLEIGETRRRKSARTMKNQGKGTQSSSTIPCEEPERSVAGSPIVLPSTLVVPRHKALGPCMSVYNAADFQSSAKAWTTPNTTTVELGNGSLLTRYHYGSEPSILPRSSNDDSFFHTIRFECGWASDGEVSMTLPLKILQSTTLDVQSLMARFPITYPPPQQGTLVGSVSLPHVDSMVLRRIASCLRGHPLLMNSAPVSRTLTSSAKAWLLQHTHVAHVLNIAPLQRAAMHALCTSVLRHAKDWADLDVSRQLLKRWTVPGNPARRVLLEGPGCILPQVSGKEGLCCGGAEVDAICVNANLDQLWRSACAITVLPIRNI